MSASGAAYRICRVLLCCTLLTVLPSCSNRPPAPIEDRGAGGTYRPEQRYTVLRGDTLYSISFRYGLDFRRLAAANRITAPYTIYPGQTLQLREADLPPTQPRASAPAVRRTSPPSVATPSGTAVAPASTAAPSPAPAATPEAASPAPKPAPARTPAGPTAPVSSWLWPSGGKVIRGFDGNLNKGIDIGGPRGAAVRATAGGRVVYAGSGIAGYGLLLILRHNNEYLSAYGHNDALLVNEGDTVRAGAVVARLGSSGTDSVKLHFEIRRNGRPIDPRSILPSRR
ncbi:MAG: peptidoglycan DD-metalloendopeptidase family protein [Pseudomonadota bacterium]